MPQIQNDFIRRIRIPAYCIVAFLSLGSIIEAVVPSWPPHPHDVNWRLGVINTSAGATGTEMLALLLLVVVAQLSLSRGALWVSFAYSLVIALGCAAIALLFGLDAVQTRGRFPIDQLGRFDLTVGWALVRFAFTEVVCLWLAACALGGARSLRREIARAEADPRAALVVGGPATAPASARSP